MNHKDRKREAIERLALQTDAAIADLRRRYPGWVGEAMACTVAQCAVFNARMIAAYTEPKQGDVIAVVEPYERGRA